MKRLPFDKRSPEALLVLLAAAVALAWSIWRALLNNFAVEDVAFTGVEIGILQSLREIPGFLAFTTVFVLLILKEQTFLLISAAILGIGVAMTGLLPSEYGLYFTTIVMSIGFHYFFTVQQSLTLQWINKEKAPEAMGLQSAAGSIASVIAFAFIWLAMEWGSVDYLWVYLVGGLVSVAAVVFAMVRFPEFKQAVPQRKHLVLRRRYWLFYALTFMSGARRQIFVVFAGFLMVEKFDFSASDIAALFLLNHLINAWFAPKIGRFISRFGERHALTLEYIGLIIIFLAYAVVDSAWLAGLLYILDHILFAMAIGIRSYFQKIADPADMASSSGVSFTINHIAAVVIPVIFGFIWIHSVAAVFIAGAAMAAVSLILARLVPEDPTDGNEVVLPGRQASPQIP